MYLYEDLTKFQKKTGNINFLSRMQDLKIKIRKIKKLDFN